MSEENTEINRENLDGNKMDGKEKSVDDSEDLKASPKEKNAVKHLQEQFHTASKNWRKQINDVRYKLVNERNVKSLELGCQALSASMKEVTMAQDALKGTLDSIIF